MAGVTVQQLLKRKVGAIVRHVRMDGGYFSQVIINGKIVSETPDDCLASGSYYQTEKIWRAFYKGKICYQLQPAFSYLPNHDVLGALDAWDRSQFEQELLPTLKAIESLDQQIECYEQHRDAVDEYDKYVLFDVLVRLYLYCRYHNITVTRNGVDGLEVTTCDQALLPGVAPKCIDLGHQFGPAVEVMYLARGGYNKVRVDGIDYLVSTDSVHALQSACCSTYIELKDSDVALWLNGGADLPEVRAYCERGEHLDPEYKRQIVELVYQILAKGGVAVTPDEKELMGFVNVVVGHGKVGRNALQGLGKILGEGPLLDRMEYVYKEVGRRARGLSSKETYKLAASKVSAMHSAKVVTMTSVGACINNRGAVDGN